MRNALAGIVSASLVLALAGCGGGTSSAASASNAAKSPIPTPTLASELAGPTWIDVKVTAGDSPGLPAGFSLQWVTAAAHAVGGWESECGASFSGNANESRYALGAGESVVVRVGDLTLDNGASTSCPQPLTCGTEYVFRAFGHATRDYSRSDFTADYRFSTSACAPAGCTYTQGYWKTHGPVPTGNNEYVWPAAVKEGGLTLGEVTYTADQLLAIFATPPSEANGLVALAHQLIAAKLNVANGADDAAIASSITAADALIGQRMVPPVGEGSLAPAVTGALTSSLDDYNNGLTGPGHCE